MTINSSKPLCLNNNMLSDDLLLEIFCRLPSCESVLQCKCVCRQWFNVISEPTFVSRFIAHKLNNDEFSNTVKTQRESDEDDEHPGLIYMKSNNHNSVIYPNNPGFTSPSRLNYWLDFLPCYSEDSKNPLFVEARCKDLVLCSITESEDFVLYICNPRTKQYIQLPAPPYRKQPYLVGFTLDPYYAFDKETGLVTLNSSCQFTVLYGLTSMSKTTLFEWEVLSSETGVWRKVVLSSPIELSFQSHKKMFTYKGVLHFYRRRLIIGFDTKKTDKNGVIKGHLIWMPSTHDISDEQSVRVGVFKGRVYVVKCNARYVFGQQLDIARVSIVPQNTAGRYIKVWELKDYDSGVWCLKHTVYLHDLVSEDSVLTEYIKRGCPNARVLSFHPNDASIVLLCLAERSVVECNLLQRTLDPICNIENKRDIYGLDFPLWPSPFPKTS